MDLCVQGKLESRACPLETPKIVEHGQNVQGLSVNIDRVPGVRAEMVCVITALPVLAATERVAHEYLHAHLSSAY